MSVIELNQITKYYGKSRGVEDLNLQVEQGDIFGFIGPNGAGKSTTIRLMLNFIFPTSGSAKIFGKEVTKYAEDIKRDIGYMPSEVFCYGSLKVKDLLEYSGKLRGIKDRKRIKELTDIFDLDINRKFEDLSFGNKKKVSIIQALLHRPKMLILDEPSNGLDPLVQKTFFELLNMENERGTTIFFSSHTLSVVQKMCRNVGIIKEGQIIKIEKIESLRKKQLRKVYIDSAEKINENYFKGVNFGQLYCKDNTVEFYYKGDINVLVRKLAEINLRSFSLQEPELEEVFMHYYSAQRGDSE